MLSFDFIPSSFFSGGNTFQKRMDSSAPPVTIEAPSGLIAMNSTLEVCPTKLATRYMLGILQMLISFRL